MSLHSFFNPEGAVCILLATDAFGLGLMFVIILNTKMKMYNEVEEFG
jgi:hypothetical protein